jgi:4-amino-4-deoxy-L-arabinose transferase-like glycosyltransferase
VNHTPRFPLAAIRAWGRDWLLAIGALAWIIAYARLGYGSLLDPDEAHYAQLTREMIRSRSWFVPLLDGSPFIDKPVLFHWLQMSSVWLFGESEFALRLPTALAGLALVAVTRWLGMQLFDRRTGNTAALMFATLPFTFALAHVALFDMVYAAFLVGGIACFIVAAIRGRDDLQYRGYLVLALAVMTKGPVALVLAGLWLCLCTCFIATARRSLGRLQWITGLVAVVVLSSPWFVYMWYSFDKRFIQEYLLAGNLWYFTGPRAFSTRASDHTFYVRTFAGAFFPWSLVAVGYGVDIWRQQRKGQSISQEDALLIGWVLTLFAFFSVARFKLDWYIFPIAPMCCVLAARGWTGLDDQQRIWTRRAVIAASVAFIGGSALTAATMFRLNLELSDAAIVVPAALAAGGILMAGSIARHRFARIPSVHVPVAALLASYAGVVLLGLPVLERSRPTAPIGRWIQRHTPPRTTVGVYGLTDWRSSIRFYSDRPLVALDDADSVRRYLDANRTGYVLMLRRDFESLKQDGAPVLEARRRRAIVGRDGTYLRRQIWSNLLVVTHTDNAPIIAGDLDDEP